MDVTDLNRHVREYLSYYLDFTDAPGFAVLVTGPWGVGKTYLVRDLLANVSRAREPSKATQSRGGHTSSAPSTASRYVYVSLFGLKSTAELDMAVLHAAHPLLGTKGAKVAGALARTALNALGADSEIQLTELLNKFNAEIYVFDDLERCEMSVNATLGYINEFVEHAGRKVIVIANEDEITGSDEYLRRREKLIGKTLQVQLALPSAAAHFISKLTDAAKDLCARRSECIQTVFLQSGLSNLRILQQTLWEWERLMPALTAEQLKNADGVDALLRLFFAFSFELKAGRIVADDLRNRLDKIVAGSLNSRDGKPPTRLSLADSRYAGIRLHDSLLSDAVLADVLIRGIIDYAAIQACLGVSSYFAQNNEPAWRTVWHVCERPEEDISTALDEMDSQFNATDFTVPGEILHVFGLRLWLAKIGVFAKSNTEVVNECQCYVDRLYSAGRLEPLSLDASSDDVRFDSFGGLSIYESKSDEYRILFEYLHGKRATARKDKFPALVDQLLSEMATDPVLYARRICRSDSSDARYARIPLFASLDPAKFVSLVLAQPPAHQDMILSAFKSRYDGRLLEGELAPEHDWLVAVRDQLRDSAREARPTTRWRIERFIEWYFSPVLNSFECRDRTRTQ